MHAWRAHHLLNAYEVTDKKFVHHRRVGGHESPIYHDDATAHYADSEERSGNSTKA